MGDHTTIDTRLATLAWSEDQILEIRIKPDMPLDVAGVSEMVEQRLKMTVGTKARVMTVLIPDMDFEIQVPTTDHHQPLATNTIAEAVVAPTNMLQKIAQMYFRYFPQSHPTGVFTDEVSARNWLNQQPAS